MSGGIDVVFLGTGGSLPTKERGLPSVALRRDGELILFDCGEGTQRQMMHAGLIQQTHNNPRLASSRRSYSRTPRAFTDDVLPCKRQALGPIWAKGLDEISGFD